MDLSPRGQQNSQHETRVTHTDSVLYRDCETSIDLAPPCPDMTTGWGRPDQVLESSSYTSMFEDDACIIHRSAAGMKIVDSFRVRDSMPPACLRNYSCTAEVVSLTFRSLDAVAQCTTQ